MIKLTVYHYEDGIIESCTVEYNRVKTNPVFRVFERFPQAQAFALELQDKTEAGICTWYSLTDQ